MRLSGREMGLAWATMVVVVLGATCWFVAPRVKETNESLREMDSLVRRIEGTQRLLNHRPQWEKRLASLRDQLPQHPAEKDVTAELLKMLERTARQHGLNLLRREPDTEKDLGDLYEVAIRCTWEGELEALVHFLYAIQIQGVILDIRNLTIAPAQGAPGRLKGSFTVDVAYTRSKAAG